MGLLVREPVRSWELGVRAGGQVSLNQSLFAIEGSVIPAERESGRMEGVWAD